MAVVSGIPLAADAFWTFVFPVVEELETPVE
jgi:hypothetical protein